MGYAHPTLALSMLASEAAVSLGRVGMGRNPGELGEPGGREISFPELVWGEW